MTEVDQVAATPDQVAAAPAQSAQVAIVVEGAKVSYRVLEDRMGSVQAMVGKGFRTRQMSLVHALKGVSFKVHVGEAVGIVGMNGAGKSTLLRAVAGLQSLSGGSVRIRGDARFLGVRAALKPALSGYRNVVLGGLALGLSRREVEDKVEEIVAFSEIGEALGRPLNTYSSGMRARLAFAIATLKVPDILLVDEALAVGDKVFRRRSLARINEFRADAGTVLMATHRLSEIRKTCSRAIWVHDGLIVADGPVEDVLTSYQSDDE